MAKKREPDELDKVIQELTRNATAADDAAAGLPCDFVSSHDIESLGQRKGPNDSELPRNADRRRKVRVAFDRSRHTYLDRLQIVRAPQCCNGALMAAGRAQLLPR